MPDSVACKNRIYYVVRLYLLCRKMFYNITFLLLLRFKKIVFIEPLTIFQKAKWFNFQSNDAKIQRFDFFHLSLAQMVEDNITFFKRLGSHHLRPPYPISSAKGWIWPLSCSAALNRSTHKSQELSLNLSLVTFASNSSRSFIVKIFRIPGN